MPPLQPLTFCHGTSWDDVSPPAGSPLGRATCVDPRHPGDATHPYYVGLRRLYHCHQQRCRLTRRCYLWPLQCRQRRGEHTNVGDTGAHGMDEMQPRDAAPLTQAKPVGRRNFIPEVRSMRVQESQTQQLSARPVSYRDVDLWTHNFHLELGGLQ